MALPLTGDVGASVVGGRQPGHGDAGAGDLVVGERAARRARLVHHNHLQVALVRAVRVGGRHRVLAGVVARRARDVERRVLGRRVQLRAATGESAKPAANEAGSWFR